MTRKRPGVLKVGDRVRFDGSMQTVVGLAGTLVRLAGYDGQASAVQLAHLLASEDFEIVGGSGQKRPPVSGSALAGLREDVAKDALRWERHIVEVFTGVDPDAEPGTEPRPQYDPAVYSLAQREEAKAAELAAAGEQVTARTVKRKRQRYETQGLAGLVDWRADRSTPARGRIDERVVDALQQAVNEKSASSTRTASFYLWRTREILARKYGPDTVPMPARATFYRLFERVTAGQHTTGSARTRQSLANRPDRPFRQLTAGRPGEIMEIDSTPLDVMVMLDNGLPGRVELTGMVDLATRTVTAAVLRPTTKSVDASLLLARTVTPEPMQPGWAEALSMTRSVLPHQRLLTLDQRLQHAAARPVMVPETIVCDHGMAFISQNFRSSCRMGVQVASGKFWSDIAEQRLRVSGGRALVAATTVRTARVRDRPVVVLKVPPGVRAGPARTERHREGLQAVHVRFRKDMQAAVVDSAERGSELGGGLHVAGRADSPRPWWMTHSSNCRARWGHERCLAPGGYIGCWGGSGREIVPGMAASVTVPSPFSASAIEEVCKVLADAVTGDQLHGACPVLP